MGLHFYDCYEFLTEGLSENVVVWQGYPYSVLWYAFFFVALQVTQPFLPVLCGLVCWCVCWVGDSIGRDTPPYLVLDIYFNSGEVFFFSLYKPTDRLLVQQTYPALLCTGYQFGKVLGSVCKSKSNQ